jgi:hypothetical protein
MDVLGCSVYMKVRGLSCQVINHGRSVECLQVHIEGGCELLETVLTGMSRLELKMWRLQTDLITSEESRLLGYKNPVRTSQETHDVSTTESSRLMLCKI